MLISLSIVFSADEAFPFLVLFGGGIGRSERVEELRFDEEVTKGVDNVSLSFPGGEYTPVCLSRLGLTACSQILTNSWEVLAVLNNLEKGDFSQERSACYLLHSSFTIFHFKLQIMYKTKLQNQDAN